MKKFLKEFKDFAIKGNFLDMAVAVVLGGAFSKVVNAVIEIFLNPILENIKIANEGESAGWLTGVANFVAILIEFLVIALVLFLIVKAFNKAKEMKKKEEAPAEPTTKKCPFCLSEIDIKATRCPHCTSELKE
jgi:large conductance mechanosensitive channel